MFIFIFIKSLEHGVNAMDKNWYRREQRRFIDFMLFIRSICIYDLYFKMFPKCRIRNQSFTNTTRNQSFTNTLSSFFFSEELEHLQNDSFWKQNKTTNSPFLHAHDLISSGMLILLPSYLPRAVQHPKGRLRSKGVCGKWIVNSLLPLSMVPHHLYRQNYTQKQECLLACETWGMSRSKHMIPVRYVSGFSVEKEKPEFPE